MKDQKGGIPENLNFGFRVTWCGGDPRREIPPSHKILMGVSEFEMKKNQEEENLDMEHVFHCLLHIPNLTFHYFSIQELDFKGEYFIRMDAARLAVYLEKKGIDRDFAYRKFSQLLLAGNRNSGVYTKRLTSRCVTMNNNAFEIAKKRNERHPRYIHYLRSCLMMESPNIERLLIELSTNREFLTPPL